MHDKHYIFCGGVEKKHSQGYTHELELGKGPGKVHLGTEKIVKKMVQYIQPVMHDFLEIASYIYVGDQLIPRGGIKSFDYGNRWHRELYYTIPVCEYDIWNDSDIKNLLEESLSFAAGETYHFEFVKRPERDRPDYFTFEGQEKEKPNYEKVIMFSGGLDSFAGALEEITQNQKKICLVSHYSNYKVYGLQQKLHEYFVSLQKATDGHEPLYIPVEINKDKSMTREKSQRTRSFLFAVLGAIMANYENLNEVTFYENGVVSCNLPWDGQTLQARATRTTHPKLIKSLSMLVSELLQRDFVYLNPYFELTKKEVVDRIVKLHKQMQMRNTRSCAGAIYQNPQTHCGTCSQCIDRRFATLAAQCLEHDPWLIYKTNIFTEAIEEKDDRAMATGFASFALQVASLTPDSFLRKYPSEMAEIIGNLYPDKRKGLSTVVSLHKRYASQINDVLTEMIANHSKDLTAGILPDTCLIQMVAMKKHLNVQLHKYEEPKEVDVIEVDLSQFSENRKLKHDFKEEMTRLANQGYIKYSSQGEATKAAKRIRERLKKSKYASIKLKQEKTNLRLCDGIQVITQVD